MREPRLLGLPLSPWSIMARWAILHRRIPHRYVRYLPLLGELGLRLRMGRLRGRVTVPVLITDRGVIDGSTAIARWADRHGEGEPLFDAAREAEIERWRALAERLLQAGRVRAVRRMLASREALAENVPAPPWLQPALWPVGAIGVQYVARKYGAGQSAEALLTEMRSALAELRAGLDPAGYLVGGRFGFADVAMTAATFGVAPPGAPYDGQTAATRVCFTEPELRDEFADVIAWRDRILAQHFPRRAERAGVANAPR